MPSVAQDNSFLSLVKVNPFTMLELHFTSDQKVPPQRPDGYLLGGCTPGFIARGEVPDLDHTITGPGGH